MKSINQINGQIENNPTIQFYFDLSNRYDKYERVWQSNSYNFIFGERKSSQSVKGTFIFGAAQKELSLITGQKNEYNYQRDHKSITYELYSNTSKITFNVSAEIDINGVTLGVMSYDFKPAYIFKRYKVRSNESWVNFDLNSYFEKHILPSYVYAPGLFRNIQICYNLPKNEVIEKYKFMLSIMKAPYEIDESKSWKQLIKKRFNCLLSDWDMFTEKQYKYMLKTFEYQKKRMKVCRAPSVFDLWDQCSSVSDTDEGIENEFHNIMDQYKNTILI